jgi:hypothetical protein
MRINKWLWGLWIAMILSMLLRQRVDTYMVVALIILPILIVLLDLHEEIATLKEDNKHQRKFVMDRYNVLQERLSDISNQIEKRLVVDFAEFAKNNTSQEPTRLPYEDQGRRPRKLKKRRRPVEEASQAPIDFNREIERRDPEQQPNEPTV